MLPKSFQQQNINKKKKLTSQLKSYTITYDYELTPSYGKYVKESYNLWGNIVDCLGIMKLTGYHLEEVIFNFHQVMKSIYVDTRKLVDYDIMEIKENSFHDELIT